MDTSRRAVIIAALLKYHHPLYVDRVHNPVPRNSNLRLPIDEDVLLEKMRAGKAYHDALRELPDEELVALGHRLEQQRLAAKERAHWSNQPPALATDEIFDHWSKAAYWRFEEAAALLLARNPAFFNHKVARNDTARPQILNSYLELHDLIMRANTAKQIDFNYGPGGYIAWAKRNRIAVPEGLEAAVCNHGHQIDDWKGIADRRGAEIAELKAKLAAVEGDGPKDRAGRPSDAMGVRERDSLLKLVIGMAIKGYAYKPMAGRNAAVTEIAGDLRIMGIPLDEDTVRKYLNEAKDLLPPETDDGR
jgi:hypothetical protein